MEIVEVVIMMVFPMESETLAIEIIEMTNHPGCKSYGNIVCVYYTICQIADG